MGDIHFENKDNKYVIKEVTTLQEIGALISKEGDSMSALKFRMNKADKALWMDIKILQKQRNCSRNETQKVQRGGPIVHSSLM